MNFPSDHEEFFGGEMKPFVSYLHQELKKVEEVLPSVPAPVAEKLNWWKRFTAMF
ncbi:MAG: hypothetical protein AB8G22_19470 [Saprospiraceae bacterium]